MLNTKTVRELIFKGADRNILNSNGDKAIDLIDKIDDVVLKNELKKILGV